MNNENRNTAVATIFGIVALAGMYITYQSLVVEPRLIREHAAETENQKRVDRSFAEIELSRCKRNATERYDSDWNLNCKNFGTDTKLSGCSLPRYIIDPIEKQQKEDNAECYQEYSYSIK